MLYNDEQYLRGEQTMAYVTIYNDFLFGVGA